jgi:predicted MFS family arabinose efflux permease
VTAGLVVLVYALVDTQDAGWGSTQTVGLLAASVVLLVAFLAVEMRAARPIMPLRIFRNRSVASADSVALLVGASLFAMFFFISLYLQQVLGYSALRAGLAYLPLAVAIIISAGVASQLVTRAGPKPVLLGGLVLTTIGLVLFGGVSPEGTYLGDVLLPEIVVAVGLGFAFVPLTIAAVSGVREREAGLASGLVNTAQQVGGALGLAILSTVANSRTDSVLASAGGPPRPAVVRDALTEGFQAAFYTGAGLAAAGILLALVAVPHVRASDVAVEQPAVA